LEFIIVKRLTQLTWSLILMVPVSVYADSDHLSSGFDQLLAYITGGMAKTIVAIAGVGVGYATLVSGQFPKKYGINTLIGIGIIFSAQVFTSMFGG